VIDICCAASVIMDRATPHQVLRSNGYRDEHGRWNDGSPDELTLDIYTQPATPDDLMQLPEDRRSEETIKFFSVVEIFGVDVVEQRQPDIIVKRGKQFEVHKVKDWSDEGFFRGIAVKMGQ